MPRHRPIYEKITPPVMYRGCMANVQNPAETDPRHWCEGISHGGWLIVGVIVPVRTTMRMAVGMTVIVAVPVIQPLAGPGVVGKHQ